MTWDPEDGADQFESLRDLVPPGGMPEAGLRLVSYLTEDGNTKWAYQAAGATTNIASLVALVEMAKIHFLTGHDGNNDHED